MLSVDGNEVARKTIAHTIPLLMSIDETFDIGLDTRTPVDFTYDVPFRFTGTIDKLNYQARARAAVGRGQTEGCGNARRALKTRRMKQGLEEHG